MIASASDKARPAAGRTPVRFRVHDEDKDGMEILLLNLDRSLDRLDRFHDVNRHLTRVTRVSAVDGRALDRDALIRDGAIDAGLPYTAGAIGCALSHGNLWKRSVVERRALTIAEDDAIFSYFFEERSRTLLQTIDPDWDFILWGYVLRQFLWVEIIPGSIISEIRFADSENNLRFDRYQFTNCPTMLMKMVNSFSSVCYSISPRGAQRLLSRCFPLRNETISLQFGGMTIQNEGIDCIANAVYPEMRSYVCVAPLAISTNEMESTIR